MAADFLDGNEILKRDSVHPLQGKAGLSGRQALNLPTAGHAAEVDSSAPNRQATSDAA